MDKFIDRRIHRMRFIIIHLSFSITNSVAFSISFLVILVLILTLDGNTKTLLPVSEFILYTVINTVKKGIPEHPPDKTYTLESWF